MFKRASLATPRLITPREFSQWVGNPKATPLDKKVPAEYIPNFWQKINTGIQLLELHMAAQGAAGLSDSNSALNLERQHSPLC